MTSYPARNPNGERKRRSLPVREAGAPLLARERTTGRLLATPYPLGNGARRVLHALVLSLCPPEPAPRSPELVARVELGALRLLRYMHPTVARSLSIALHVVDLLPLLWLSSRLHRLSPPRASALLDRWGGSRFGALRLLVAGLRSIVLSVYFDQDEVHRALGYEPVAFIRRRFDLRSRLLSPVPLAAE